MNIYLFDVINGSALPMLHLNLDLWTCSTSHDNYIGTICFYQRPVDTEKLPICSPPVLFYRRNRLHAL